MRLIYPAFLVVGNSEILKIFGVSIVLGVSPRTGLKIIFSQYVDKKEVEDIQYITYLLMARAGLRALEFYDPATKKHGQAHMQARYGDRENLKLRHNLLVADWASLNTL